MEEFVRLDLDPVLSDIAHGILLDEARHLGFNHIYLEDHFKESFAGDPARAEEDARRLTIGCSSCSTRHFRSSAPW